jgi:NAD-dependent deacetylase
MMKKLVVLTGAGVSADSGLATFRDSGGLWEGYDIEEVASIEGYYRNRGKVLDFYNMRRAQAAKAQPNAAHRAVAELESHFDVTIVTQNVDDLHERAGSTSVIHLHGLLRQAKSEQDDSIIIDIGSEPIKLGDKAPDGAQLRPNIVWFGEPVPMIETAAMVVSEADIFVVIGTSLAVYPAAGLVNYTPPGIRKFIIDPSVPELYTYDGWTHIKKKAAEGMPELAETIKDFLND